MARLQRARAEMRVEAGVFDDGAETGSVLRVAEQRLQARRRNARTTRAAELPGVVSKTGRKLRPSDPSSKRVADSTKAWSARRVAEVRPSSRFRRTGAVAETPSEGFAASGQSKTGQTGRSGAFAQRDFPDVSCGAQHCFQKQTPGDGRGGGGKRGGGGAGGENSERLPIPKKEGGPGEGGLRGKGRGRGQGFPGGKVTRAAGGAGGVAPASPLLRGGRGRGFDSFGGLGGAFSTFGKVSGFGFRGEGGAGGVPR